MYQALYRKWRPKTFDEVIGQEHITETLKNQVRTGHLSHAYIFIGTRGTGKTTCARILAKAVNCENPIDGNPCNRCRYCRGIDDGSILDIVELDAASNTGVDNVRDLKEEAIFSPAAAKKRVYIIDEVHMLSMQAFNALLKIIEEPPEHLMFILATTELQKVPATILSRCQRHSFRRIPTERLAAYLQEIAARESLQLEPEAAVQIGRLAEGGVRDALSILDQCSAGGRITVNTVFETMGLAGNRNLVELLQVILRHDSASALQLFQQIWLDGKEPATFLGELNGLLRDVMIVKAAGAGAEELISGNYERDDLNSFARSMTAEEILYCARLEAEMKKGISVQSRIEVPVESANQPAASEPEGLQDSAKSMLPVENKPEEPESGPELPQDDGQNAVEPEPVPAAPEDAVSGILQAARINLPIEIRFAVDDPSRFRMSLYGQDLILEAIPGFLFERMKRPEIRNVFSAAAQRITGVPVAVQVQELKPDQRSLRDLNELKQFPEVSFLS